MTSRSALRPPERPRRERVPRNNSTSSAPQKGGPRMFTAGPRKRDSTGGGPRLAVARPRRLGAVALVLPPILLLTACTTEAPAPAMVKVTRASVTSTVTATGSLQAISEQKLGFADSGKLVELNVAVGQQVEPGQVLARIDDFDAQQKLKSAQAQLAKERAALARIRGGTQVVAAADDAEHATAILQATQEQAHAIDQANESAVEQAKRQLKLDEEIHESAEDRARPDRHQCEDAVGEDSDRRHSEDRPAVCERADQSEAEVEAAERQVRASKAALEQASQKQRVEHAQQVLASENARRDMSASKNEAKAARSDRPHNIDEQAATVAQLEVEVGSAQRNADNTVLHAPVAGKIASINGVVGEFLAAGSGTTSLAPGNTVPLPQVNTGVSSTDQSSDGPAGGSAFIVLDDVKTFQIVAPFAEADAARLDLNDPVQVTFDAVPDLVRTGRVVGIAPTGTDVQGVMSYYAAVVLDELDPRIKDGQTAAVHVVVDHRDDALVVPNAAILQSAETGVVTVQDQNGAPRQVQVKLGLRGDSVTQVVSGLNEGQQVIIAQSEPNPANGPLRATGK
jgi:HlyD family secretion protein